MASLNMLTVSPPASARPRQQNRATIPQPAQQAGARPTNAGASASQRPASGLAALTVGNLAAQGRDGDNMLAHINPAEAQVLRSMGGRGTINPRTGLREFAGGTLQYVDGQYTMSDGSALPWQADDGGSAGGPETTRTPRAMSGNSEAAEGEVYANRGVAAAPTGGGTDSRYQGFYDAVSADPDGKLGQFARDQIAQDGSLATQGGYDWNKATGWTDADYARRAAEMGTQQPYDEAAATARDEVSAAANRNENKPWQQSGGIYGDAPSRNRAGGANNDPPKPAATPTPAPAAGGAGGADNNGGNGNRLPAEDPYLSGKPIYQVNPSIPGAPPAIPWGTAPGGTMPAGAWPSTMMDPRSGTTTYQAAPPPGANGQWLNPNLLPWDVRNGGTGDPYVPWTPEWAAKQAMAGNGYAAQALANAGYDLEKIAPGAAAGALKSGQGVSNAAGFDRGWQAQGFYQTKDGVYQDHNGVLQIPQGNGLFLDTMYGFLRNQQGIIVNADGSPVITQYNAGYPQGSSDPWRVFGSSQANSMMGQYAGLDLRSMNDGNNTPIRGNYGGGTPTPITGKYLNDIRGNPWQGNPTPQHMGGGPTGPNTPPGNNGGGGGGGPGTGPQNPTDPVVTPQPTGGAGAPVQVPYIPAPRFRTGYAPGFGQGLSALSI